MADTYKYVTFIRTTPDKLWDALTKPEFTRLYWFGMHQESEWKKGSSWKLVFPDGRVADQGEILECDRPKRLVVSWRNEFRPEIHEEGFSRCTYDLEYQGDVVKLSITHTIDKDHSKLIEAVSGGWPSVLSGLKTYLETGAALQIPRTPK